MKKKLLVVLLLNLSVLSMSHANTPQTSADLTGNTVQLPQLKYGKEFMAVGNINTSITEIITLKPDVAEFSITYLTEGSTPNDASNRNVTNMKKLNEYLNQLGIPNSNLTTVGYQNYQQEQQQTVDNQGERYSSTFTINLDINNKQFFDVVKLLDKNQIGHIQQDSYKKYYIFKIQETSDTADKAKQLSQQKYKLITDELNQIGVQSISVADYDNQIMPADSERVKKYYVQNTLKIKVNEFDSIGKIIAKAQELKMTVNNDMTYNVSETAKNDALAKYEQLIYDKLAAKATRLMGQQYQLGVPTNLSSNENSYLITPKNYGYSSSRINAKQDQMFYASNIDIQAPNEFTITLTMSGSFEIIKKIEQ